MPDIDYTDRKEVAGLSIPAELDIPDDEIYEMKFGDTVVKSIKADGMIYLCQQAGLEHVETAIVDWGTDENGIKYAICHATLTFADGQSYDAKAAADVTSDQVNDEEHLWSVAETRSIKRAGNRALGIHSIGESSEEEPSTPHRADPASGSSSSSDDDGGVPTRPEDDPESPVGDSGGEVPSSDDLDF